MAAFSSAAVATAAFSSAIATATFSSAVATAAIQPIKYSLGIKRFVLRQNRQFHPLFFNPCLHRRPKAPHLSIRCFSALSPGMKSTLDTVVKSHKVLLFMKGTKDFPQCGFSNTVVQILKSLNVPFETMNILENEMLRQGLKEYSSWPTFPQLYIDGEFFGGCDITVEAYKDGQLQEVVEKAMCS